ncbi:MAG: hypothetical protein WAO55_00420 [Candidatus Manganitrophaceae bacterium]
MRIDPLFMKPHVWGVVSFPRFFQNKSGSFPPLYSGSAGKRGLASPPPAESTHRPVKPDGASPSTISSFPGIEKTYEKT